MKTNRRFIWVKILGAACLLAGISLLGYVAWQVHGTDLVADAEQDSLVEAYESESVTIDASLVDKQPDAVSSPDATVPAPELRYGEMFGVLRIPRFGNDYARPMFEATDAPTLKKGIGHYIGTAGPCQTGNFAIASHRMAYGGAFRDVEQLQAGDEILVETHAVSCTYVVEESLIVAPSETAVIAAVPGKPGQQPSEAYLTITTCHPVYSDAERYVVHARLNEETVER